MRNKFFICCFGFLTIILFNVACRKKDPQPVPFGNKTLITFEFRDFNPIIVCSIGADDTIRGTLPVGTSLLNLRPVLTHNGASISPLSGEAKDFTNIVTYTVTPQSGSPKNYYAKISVSPIPATTKTITSFEFRDFSPIIVCNIGSDDTIRGSLPVGSSLTNLRPTIMHTGVSINPVSGVAIDFTNVVTYTVTPQSGSPKNYYAKIVVQKSDEKKMLSFNFDAFNPIVTGSIDEPNRKIQFRFPSAIDPNGQIPAITVSNRATVSPASGIAQNFYLPQTYLVTAESGTNNVYTTELLRPDASGKDVPKPPKYLAIYYDCPSKVNGSNGNAALAFDVFKQFDIIVFADALLNPAHSDHNFTINLISQLKAYNPGIKIFGYIDVGVFAPGQPWIHNYSESQLQQFIDQWKAMGANGVFGDDFGYDYQVTRSRQNVFIDYAHSKGLSVFANSGYIGNSLNGNDCHLGSAYGDYYLMESFLVGHNNYTGLQDNIKKADSAYYYMKTKGVGIACVSSLTSVTATSNTTDKYKMAWHGTAMYNFDAFQFTDMLYSANNCIGPNLYHYSNPITSYGSSWQQWDWIKKVSVTRYERATNTNTFYIDGDGVTTGTGGH